MFPIIAYNIFVYFKVEYHANENPLKKSEKIAYLGQRLMYPMIKKYLTMLVLFWMP